MGTHADAEHRLLDDLAAAMPVGLCVWELEDPGDPPGMRMVFANAAMTVTTGVPLAELVGLTLRESFPALAETTLPAIYAEVALGGAARTLGDVVYGDDHTTEHTYTVRLFPLPGRRLGIAFNDVTDERRATERTLETLETMSEAFYTVDRDWNFTYLNSQCEPLLQRTRGELLGTNVWEQFPHAVGTTFEDELHRAAREQVAVEFEEYYEPLHTWFALRAYPTPDGVAVYYHDVTARRKLEAQLLQAQRLEAIGLLAGGVAHDFNNLLTVIEGYASLAQLEVETSPFLGQALAEIRGAAGRATALTGKLLAFSCKQTLQSTVADSNAIVSSALDLVDSLIGDDITIHRQLDPDAGSIHADVAQIEQVIVNLVVNAKDAMPDGGNVHVESKRVELDAGSISDLEQGAYVRLTVRDDGCGMDHPTREQIFDPFFTTKPMDRGTGLGLSSAYGTITQSGGHIGVASKPGEGSTFTIHLPRCGEQPIHSTHAGLSESDAWRGGGERILVVEDQENVRSLMVRILGSCGYDVAQAANAQDALGLCASHDFDLMVTDLVMPGGDGMSLARTVALRHPRMPVLFISGYAPDAGDRDELGASAAPFLAKPFSTDELTRRVRELLCPEPKPMPTET